MPFALPELTQNCVRCSFNSQQDKALDEAAGEVHAVYALLEEHGLTAPAEDR